VSWREAFSKSKWPYKKKNLGYYDAIPVQNLKELKDFLDIVHVREALLHPYFETKKYPLVEARSLLPSFETDVFEYAQLPGFSLIALDRPLASFREIFQYDMLHPISDFSAGADGPCCPLEGHVAQSNSSTMLAHMPRFMHEEYRRRFQRTDITVMELYPELLPYLLEMDRAHVITKSSYDHFQLSGIFASLPSDIDGEMKRFGIRVGKFSIGENELYERNRNFIMQFLMELYGFPIASERRTSAALFSRRLHKMGEKFIIRVLGQSDRTITTIWNDGTAGRYPNVEKIALIKIDEDHTEIIENLHKANAFVDAKKRIVIVRVTYRQHAFDIANIRQDRALSVEHQYIIHPITGENIEGINVIKDSTNLILRLNDIVRGEFHGRILYKRTEVVENTDTEEKQLKFLHSWFSKHQRRVVGYSDEFFLSVCKILKDYFDKLHETDEDNASIRELIIENKTRFSFIQQARKVRYLEDIRLRKYKGERLTYSRMMTEAVDVVKELRFELVHYFEDIAESALFVIDTILNDKYLRKNYIEKQETSLTETGIHIRKKYSNLVVLRDEINAIKKSRKNVDSPTYF